MPKETITALYLAGQRFGINEFVPLFLFMNHPPKLKPIEFPPAELPLEHTEYRPVRNYWSDSSRIYKLRQENSTEQYKQKKQSPKSKRKWIFFPFVNILFNEGIWNFIILMYIWDECFQVIPWFKRIKILNDCRRRFDHPYILSWSSPWYVPFGMPLWQKDYCIVKLQSVTRFVNPGRFLDYPWYVPFGMPNGKRIID